MPSNTHKSALAMVCLAFIAMPFFAQAQSTAAPDDVFYRGSVVQILEDKMVDVGGSSQPYQKLRVRVEDGLDAGNELVMEYGGEITIEENQKLAKGEGVVLRRSSVAGTTKYHIEDSYRLTPLMWIAIAFFIVAVFFGRIKGFTSVLGMVVSLGILTKFVIPHILGGGNPLLFSLLGASIIAMLSLYLAHGFNRRTSIALGGTMITLGISAALSIICVALTKLSGAAQEEASYLHLEALPLLDLRGLLMGGIIIGALGILDDVTTAQVAVVDELKKANASLSHGELYRRGISVGQEHIASLINTLVLAYAGASFPLLLIFALDTTIPLWVNLNAEFIAEEVVRTLVGSISLVFAVPISTFLAAYFLSKKKRHNAS